MPRILIQIKLAAWIAAVATATIVCSYIATVIVVAAATEEQ